MRWRVSKSARDTDPVTIGEGAAIAGIVTTIGYAFRWLIGLEGRMNARDLVDAERSKRLDERHLELLSALVTIRAELRAIRTQRKNSDED